jgi:ABC-type transport system involved in multi-copper enzyme maturation permease subunit
MNKPLLWKDYRIFRDVFMGGLVLIAASYAMALMVLVINGELSWTTFLGGGASLTRFFAILVGALFGGYAFAFEREERSDLFLAVLPISRPAQLKSKLLLASVALALYWIISMAIVVVALGIMGVTPQDIVMSMRAMLDFVAASIMVFGIAWRLSASARSPLTAAFSGLMALFPLCIAQAAATHVFELAPFYFFSGLTLIAMVLLGAIGVINGSRHFLQNNPTKSYLGVLSRGQQNTMRGSRAASSRKGTPLKALLWKDYQLVKTPLWVGVGVILLPHGWSVLSVLSGDGAISLGGCLLSIALCTLVFPFWAGQLMGAERASRTVEFLAPLPIVAGRAMVSKCLVLIVTPLSLSILNIGLLVYANNGADGAIALNSHMAWANWYEPAELTAGLALGNGALLALAVTWILAARSPRALVAIIVGMLMSPVTVTVWAGLSTWSSESSTEFLTPLNFVLSFALVVAGMVSGLVASGGVISASNSTG